MAQQHPFFFLALVAVVICRECCIGVRRAHIATHLRQRHPHLRPFLRTIITEIQAWFSQVSTADVESIPTVLQSYLPYLPTYEDGFLCQFEADVCSYICRNETKIREHLRTQHEWSEYRRRGRPSQAVRNYITSQGQTPWTVVRCQRIFPSGPDSHYIHVLRQDSPYNPSISRVGTDVFAQVDALRTSMQDQRRDRIQSADELEVNP